MTLAAFVLKAMTLLAPDRDFAADASTIASVVEGKPPLFKGDESRVRSAALVLAIAWRESGFRNDAHSSTNDHCMMQIHARPELARDLAECIRVGVAMLRESMRACAAHPVAFYASGPGGCANARAQRISRDRMNLAAWLVLKVQP